MLTKVSVERELGNPDRRMRLLRRPRPRIDVAQGIVAAFPRERSVLGPGAVDEIDGLPELLARGRRGHIVIERLRSRPRRKAGDQAAVRHVVEHGVFLRHAQRVEMQRQQVAENDDLAALGLLRQRGGDQIGRRHQAIDVLVMLVEHHAVEADLVGIGELVDIFLIEAAASLCVPQAVRHGDPAGLVSLVEIGGQIRIGHEVPAIELDRPGHAALPDSLRPAPKSCRARRAGASDLGLSRDRLRVDFGIDYVT